MAITTQAGVLSGLQTAQPFVQIAGGTSAIAGYPVTFFKGTGSLGTGNSNFGLTGANFSSTAATPAGCIYHQDPLSGNAYLARLRVSASAIGTFQLCDRLWDCQPVTNSLTAQNISQPTLPARDAAGGTTGLGVRLAIEVIGATSATAAVISVSYTNSAGTAGQIATFYDLPTAAVAAVGRFYRLNLAAGDLGVQSVQSVTFPVTDWTSGTIAIVAYRELAVLDLPYAGVPNEIDCVSGAFPRLYNGVSLFPVMICTANATPTVSALYLEAQG